MNLLKESKGTDLVSKVESGEVMVGTMRTVSYKGVEIMHVTIKHDGKTSRIPVSAALHKDLKVGRAMLVQTEWSKESSFPGVTTKITNF